MGEELAKEQPAAADIVVGLPDSAVPAAIGFARQSGLPYTEALIKNRYIGRTFIQPDQHLREMGVSLKFNALPEVLEGKRVVLVDDTIVAERRVNRLCNCCAMRAPKKSICACTRRR